MIRRTFYSIFLGILLFTVPVQSEAKEINLAVGFSVAPYIIQESDSGIELDIIREALAYKGHSMKATYLPFIEIDRAMIDNNADAIATVEEKIGIDGHFSDHVITYTNYAISLASKGLSINSITDLADKSVTSFQLSTKYLGSEFAEMAKSNPRFREKEEHTLRIKLLFDGRIEVVIIDDNIFKYYSKEVADKTDISQLVTMHDVFPKNKYKVIFKDAAIRDDFNEGLKHLRESGQYQKVFDKYLQ